MPHHPCTCSLTSSKKSPHCAGFLDRNCSCSVVVVIIPVVAVAAVDAGDLPDHAGPRNLHQRGVCGVMEGGIRIGAARIAHRAVVDEVCGAIGPETDGGGPVDPAQTSCKCLLALALATRRAVRIPGLRCLRAVESKAR